MAPETTSGAAPVEGARASPIDPWRALAEAATAEQLCSAWLQVLCRALLPAETGLVLLAQPDGAFAPVAAWPGGGELAQLREVATRALRERASATEPGDAGRLRLAYPLLAGERLHGAVVLELARPASGEAERASQLLQWGAGWLLGLMHQREVAEQRRRQHEGGFLLDTLLGLLADRSPREASLALANRIGQEFDSPQVMLALAEGPGLTVQALSHAAWFEARSGLLRLALAAMHETLDQRRRVVWPLAAAADPATATVVAASHRRYAEEAGAVAVASVPLLHDAQAVGVLMLELRQPPGPAQLEFLDSIALGVAPALAATRAAHEGALRRARRTLRDAMALTLGPRYPAAKLGAGLVLVVLGLLAVVPVPFRIAAQATVEGAVQRAAVAPFEGYLREAPARAGDVVKAGQVLATLDDRDLRLERTRWEAELEVALRKEREAMAGGNAVEQRLAAAQANQARAQLDLASARLERVQITAPFDGTVVRGDLSQQLGSPVEQGKVLFELAPLDAWRVILKVDERDIGHVQVGAAGELVLASLPGQSWPFHVKKLTPVAVAEDGRNHFRVEAELGQGAPRLSPNMEGVGKIEAGEASPLWIWTRPLVDAWRLLWWKLLP